MKALTNNDNPYIAQVILENVRSLKDCLFLLDNYLKANKIQIFVDEDDVPIYGMIVYLIDYSNGKNSRYACVGYYPFWDDKLFPHPYQESICW